MEATQQESSRLSAVKAEVTRLQSELGETEAIRKEAQLVNDPELTAECTAAEERLKALIAELSAEASRLQKGSGADALRARLQQMRTSEARARSLLGSGDLSQQDVHLPQPSSLANPVSKPGVPATSSLTVTPQPPGVVGQAVGQPASPRSTHAQLQIGSPVPASSPRTAPPLSPRQEPETDLPKKIPLSALPPVTMPEPSAAGQTAVPHRSGEGQSWEGGFDEPSPFGAAGGLQQLVGGLGRPVTPQAADTASVATKASDTSMEVHKSRSHRSLDSLADSTSGAAEKSKAPSTRASPRQPPAAERAASGSLSGPDSGQARPKSALASGAPDVGFGEAAFILPDKADTNRTHPPPQQAGLDALGIEEPGKSMSLRDSFLKEPTPSKPSQSGQASSGWQAFDAQKSPGPKGNPAIDFPGLDVPKPQASDEFETAAFGAAAFRGPGDVTAARSMSHSPAPSARSGNPFQDFLEPSDAGQGPAKDDFPTTFENQQWATRPPPPPPAGAFNGFGPSAFPQQPPQSRLATVSGPQPADSNADPFASSGFMQQPFQGQQQQPLQPDLGAAYDPFSGQPPPSAGMGRPAMPGGAFAAASAGAPASAAIRPGTFPVAPRNLQASGSPLGFASPQAGTQQQLPGFQPLQGFAEPARDQFVVTHSMVIPEADWEAAFAPAKPAKAAEAKGGLIGQTVPEEPQETSNNDETSSWAPMTEHDHTRCEQAFRNKYGGEEAGGIGLAQARELHRRAEIPAPVERVFALADLDGDGRLRRTEFHLFMYLLKIMRGGAALPSKISNERIAYLLGVGVDTLPAREKKATAAAPEATSVHIETSSRLQELISKGSVEEDAKRALFLNGDDPRAAEAWLREKKLLRGQKADDPALTVNLDSGPAETSPFASGADAQPETAETGTGGLLSIKIEKALVSYKKPVDRPLFQASLRDAYGRTLEPEIDTPPCSYDKSNGIFQAGHTVVFTTPADKIPDGAVVYLELKHWKSKEKKWSTLGWTFAAKESFIKLVDGRPVVRTEAQGVHLYEKPMDPESHFSQKAMRKLKPMSQTPDLYLRVSEHTGPLET